MRKLTNTLGRVVVDGPPDVARLALQNAIYGTLGRGLCHAIIACTNVHCFIAN